MYLHCTFFFLFKKNNKRVVTVHPSGIAYSPTPNVISLTAQNSWTYTYVHCAYKTIK